MATTEEKPQPDGIAKPYLDLVYQQKKQHALGVIGKSNVLNAISRNAGMINGTLATIIITTIITGSTVLSGPLVAALLGTTLLLAGFSAYASYMDEKMSREAGYGYDEARMVASTRVGAAANVEIAKENAHQLAIALKDTLGEELKDIRKESCQTQAAVAHLQHKMLSWQEREEAKVPAEKQLH